jgi:hypothetical protein
MFALPLSVVPSIDPCAHDALLQLGPFTPTGDGSFTWHNVNITSGTPVYVVADDDSDAEAWTQIVRSLSLSYNILFHIRKNLHLNDLPL